MDYNYEDMLGYGNQPGALAGNFVNPGNPYPAPAQVDLSQITGSPDAVSGADQSGMAPIQVQAPIDAPQEPQDLTSRLMSNAQSRSDSVSVGQSGMDEAKLERIRKGDRAGQNAAARMNKYDQQMNPVLEGDKAVVGKQNFVNTYQNEIDQEMAKEHEQLAIDEAGILHESENAITRIHADGEARIKAATHEWDLAKEKAMSMSINPGAMWQGMTGGEKTGSLMSVFISGFLGAKGIETGIMATLEKAVDRNIAAQKDNMDQANREVGFAMDGLSIARDTSVSELEWGYKAKDLAIESFRRDAAARMAAFDSPLAQAKFLQADAKLAEYQNGLREKHMNARVNQENIVTSQEQAAEHARRQDAISSGQLALARSQAERQARREDAAAESSKIEELNSMALVDPTGSGDKFLKFRATIAGPAHAATRTKLQEKANSTAKLNGLLTEFRSLSKSVGPAYDGPLKNIGMDERKARLLQIKNNLTNTLAKEWSGLTYTDGFAKKIAQMIPTDNWGDAIFDSKKAEQMAGSLSQFINDDFFKEAQGFTEPFRPEELPYLRNATTGPVNRLGVRAADETPGGFFEDQIVDANVATQGSPTDHATENQNLADSNSVADRTGVVKADETTQNIVAGFYEKKEAADPNTLPDGAYNASAVVRRSGKVPENFSNIVKLGINARTNDSEAAAYLEKLANEKTGVGRYKQPSEDAVFARYVQQELGLIGNPEDVAGKSYTDAYLQERQDALRNITPVNQIDLSMVGGK